jgi:hypothetical protein
MPKTKTLPPALKHAAYSAMTLLPGEDPAEFEKLQKAIISELMPVGALEDDIVADIVQFHWRKQNLRSFRIAKYAANRLETIRSEKGANITYSLKGFDPPPGWELEPDRDPEKAEAAAKAAEEQARKELGSAYEFIRNWKRRDHR